jgi:tRNA dimethylallyltransferase
MKPKIVFLVGPTAIGKTKISVILAKKINAEIISCDSMQVYKGMDIVTSKPPLTIRKEVRHHLIDIISPIREYNVSRYRQAATRKIKEILNRAKTPLFVGGTGLYMSILIDGIFKSSPTNKNIRNHLYRQAEKQGSAYLYNRLKIVDPEAATKIHPHDTKRIVRALEVFKTTGQPISSLQKQRWGLPDKYDIKIFCLNMERNKLYKRIEKRVDSMFRKGLVKEAKKLLELRLSKTAAYAIGIKELKGYFTRSYDLEEAKQLIKRNSRLYAKRQLTWFRKDKRINWVNIDDREKPKEVACKIWKKFY